MLPKQARGTFRKHVIKPFSQPAAQDCGIRLIGLIHQQTVTRSHLVVCEFELLHLSVDDGGALPVRCRLRDERLRPLQAVPGRPSVSVHSAT